MKSLFKLLILSMSLLVGMTVSAQEIKIVPGGNNDPRFNVEANACYWGGTLAGKCDTTDVNEDKVIDKYDRDWMWLAGWHLIRYEYNVVDSKDFDEAYLDVLPPEPIRKIKKGEDVCYKVEDGYLRWRGGSEPTVVKIYYDSICHFAAYSLINVIAIETDVEAQAICTEYLGPKFEAQEFEPSFFQCVQTRY